MRIGSLVSRRMVFLFLALGLAFSIGGCKKEEGPNYKKGTACVKSAIQDSDICKKCCLKARFKSYNWTSERCWCK